MRTGVLLGAERRQRRSGAGPATLMATETTVSQEGPAVPSGSSIALPGPDQRLRCSACGNLTRFDVVTRRRTTGYWHYTLAGELSIEGERDLEAVAESLRCRWCGSERDVEVIPAPAGGHGPALAGRPQPSARRQDRHAAVAAEPVAERDRS